MKSKKSLNSYPTWNSVVNKWMKDPVFRKVAAQQEANFQLQRNLINLRIKKKLSQEELATKIGSKQPVISRIESGSVKPSFDILQRIADAVGARLIVKFAY